MSDTASIDGWTTSNAASPKRSDLAVKQNDSAQKVVNTQALDSSETQGAYSDAQHPLAPLTAVQSRGETPNLTMMRMNSTPQTATKADLSSQ